MKTKIYNYAIVTKSLLILLTATLTVFSSCKKEDGTEPEAAPEIPPETSMVMNFPTSIMLTLPLINRV